MPDVTAASAAEVSASHQTGWTAVVAKLLEQTATQRHAPRSSASPPPITSPATERVS